MKFISVATKSLLEDPKTMKKVISEITSIPISMICSYFSTLLKWYQFYVTDNLRRIRIGKKCWVKLGGWILHNFKYSFIFKTQQQFLVTFWLFVFSRIPPKLLEQFRIRIREAIFFFPLFILERTNERASDLDMLEFTKAPIYYKCGFSKTVCCNEYR